MQLKLATLQAKLGLITISKDVDLDRVDKRLRKLVRFEERFEALETRVAELDAGAAMPGPAGPRGPEGRSGTGGRGRSARAAGSKG